MGQVIVTPAELQVAAVKYRQELILLPIIGLQRATKYMTPIPGIRGKEVVGTANFNAQFGPYKADRKGKSNLDIEARELETFFGNVAEDFEPNSAAIMVYGQMAATVGDAQKNTNLARLVLASVAMSLSDNLYYALWNAVKNPSGDDSKDLFNGFDTITQAELSANKLSAELGNYVKMTEAITSENAVDVVKSWMYAMAPELREQETFMFCSIDIADKYNEAYKATGAGLPYNEAYKQVYAEGSNNMCTIIPLANKKGSNFVHITTKSNMLVGYDSMSGKDKIQIDRFAPFVLTYSAAMSFGVNFHSINKKRLFVADLRTE